MEQLCIDLNWMVNETINIFAHFNFFLDKQYTFHLSFTELFENVITIKKTIGEERKREDT